MLSFGCDYWLGFLFIPFITTMFPYTNVKFLTFHSFFSGSFYIHRSLFTEVTNSSWKLDAPSNIDSTIYPLLTLFKLLKMKPYQEVVYLVELSLLDAISLCCHINTFVFYFPPGWFYPRGASIKKTWFEFGCMFLGPGHCVFFGNWISWNCF